MTIDRHRLYREDQIIVGERPMYVCRRCGHVWQGYSIGRLPRSCAACRSSKWNAITTDPRVRNPDDLPSAHMLENAARPQAARTRRKVEERLLDKRVAELTPTALRAQLLATGTVEGLRPPPPSVLDALEIPRAARIPTIDINELQQHDREVNSLHQTEKSESHRSEQSESPGDQAEGGVSHSPQGSAMSPNGVTVGSGANIVDGVAQLARAPKPGAPEREDAGSSPAPIPTATIDMVNILENSIDLQMDDSEQSREAAGCHEQAADSPAGSDPDAPFNSEQSVLAGGLSASRSEQYDRMEGADLADPPDGAVEVLAVKDVEYIIDLEPIHEP